jgi:serine kinase of HPr protein (carbohydrate metabolism regulator)
MLQSNLALDLLQHGLSFVAADRLGVARDQFRSQTHAHHSTEKN